MPQNVDTADSRLISRFESELMPPQELENQFEESETEAGTWAALSRYVSKLHLEQDSKTAVVTNFILKTQNAIVGNTYPRDPAPVIQPAAWLGEPGQDTYPPDWLSYVGAQAIIVDKQQKKARLKSAIKMALQHAHTFPVGWIKMVWQEELTRNAIGQFHTSDDNTTLAQYTLLKNAFDDEAFDKDSSEYAELLDLADAVKARMIENLEAGFIDNPPASVTDVVGNEIAADPRSELLEKLQKPEFLPDTEDLPTISRYQGYAFDTPRIQDIRIDWRIKRADQLPEARWVHQRVPMSRQDVVRKWQLSAEDQERIFGEAHAESEDNSHIDSTQANAQAQRDIDSVSPTDRTLTSSDMVNVWERWDRIKNRVYRWVEGTSEFLDEYTPITTDRFYPFFALQFNTDTEGFYAASEAEMLTPLQEEMNTLRTHDAEARISSYPKYLAGKGLLTSANKNLIRTASPYAVIEVEKPDDFANSVVPLVPTTYDPRLYDGNRARQDYEAMSGMPQSGLGVSSGADFATSEAIANQQFGVQTDTRKDVVMELLQDIYTAMTQMNALRLGADNAVALAGPGTVWMADSLERRQILDNFLVEVEASPSSEAAARRELDDWMQIVSLASQMGLPLNIGVLQKVLRLKGIRANVSSFVDLGALLQQQAPPPPDGNAPADQGAAGAAGGRPPTDAPPEPEGVTNRPNI